MLPNNSSGIGSHTRNPWVLYWHRSSDIAESWISLWVRRDETTGLWSSLCSSNLMCGLIPGYMPSSCFHAEERTYRMLMEGVASSSHQTSADHVTDCLQESSSPSLCTLCLFCWGNDFSLVARAPGCRVNLLRRFVFSKHLYFLVATCLWSSVAIE